MLALLCLSNAAVAGLAGLLWRDEFTPRPCVVAVCALWGVLLVLQGL